MPLTPKRAATGPRRRSLLVGAAGVLGSATLLAGCSDPGAAADRKQARLRHTLQEKAARDSEVLLARYESTAAVHPDLADDLTPLREHVAAHLAAFRGTSAKSHKNVGRRRSRRTAVPRDPRAALTALADAESRAAEARTRALTHAPPELARLLASVAACGTVHVRVLKERAA
jgi:hypothetical protein